MVSELWAGQREASVREFGNWQAGTLKCHADWARYEQMVRQTRPDLVVEIGRYNGRSADRFAAMGVPVVSVDINFPHADWRPHPDVVAVITGDSVRMSIISQVAGIIGLRRAMIVLDSDHSSAHVYQEIKAYGPLVGVGCHLVVEDGILAWLDRVTLVKHTCFYDGDPLEAIGQALADGLLDKFDRDTAIEMGDIRRTDPQPTMSPMGWWQHV